MFYFESISFQKLFEGINRNVLLKLQENWVKIIKYLK